MMRPLEALVFLSLAAGLHVGVWSVAPRLQGATAEGSPGQSVMTLAAAAPQQAALVQAWQAAPQVAQQAAQPVPMAETAIPDRPETVPDVRHLPPAPPTLSPILPATRPRSETAPVRTVPAPTAQPPEPPRVHAMTDASPMVPQLAPAPHRPSVARLLAAAPDAPVLADQAPPPRPDPAPKPAKKPRAAQAKPASAASTASDGGTANRNQAGRSGKDSTQSANAAARTALQAKWGAQVQRKVHRQLIYPRGVSGAGNARVALTIDRAGRLTGLRLTHSSGVDAFDTAALNAVRRAGRFPTAPSELTEASYTFTLSLAFRP